MKTYQYHVSLVKFAWASFLIVVFLTVTSLQTLAQNSCNSIQNGNFESYNTSIRTPSNYTEDDIRSGESDSFDGTPSWRALNVHGGDLYNTAFTNIPTDAHSVNPNDGPSHRGFYGPFTPHNGSLGAIQIQSAELNAPTYPAAYSEYVAQQVNLAGGNYYAEFWIQESKLATNYPSDANIGFMPITMEVRSNDPGMNTQYIGPNVVQLENPQHSIVSNAAGTSRTTWNRVSGTMNLPKGTQFVVLGCYTFGANKLKSVYFIDDVALYLIPSAGNSITKCPEATVTIGTGLGSGCDITGARYAWTVVGSSAPPFAFTPQTQVSPQVTTIYTLTVTLPDGSTKSSNVTVNVTSLSAPQLTVVKKDLCTKIITYQIVNYNPAYTYNVGAISSGLSLLQPNPLSSATFSLQAINGATGGTFNLTASGCGSATSSFSVNFESPYTPIPEPLVEQTGSDGCVFQNYFRITNFDPSLTYTGTAVNGTRVTVIFEITPTANFRVKGGQSTTYGAFTITAKRVCGGTTVVATTTSQVYDSYYSCPLRLAAPSAQAYPNPVSESLTLPALTQSATLINNQGRTVQHQIYNLQMLAVEQSNQVNETLDSPDGKLKPYSLNNQSHTVQHVDTPSIMDISHLPDGLYNLQMRVNSVLVNQRIEIKH